MQAAAGDQAGGYLLHVAQLIEQPLVHGGIQKIRYSFTYRCKHSVKSRNLLANVGLKLLAITAHFFAYRCTVQRGPAIY